MSILAECPRCHKKQGVKNKRCLCGADLDKLKRAKEKVRYWVSYRLPGGKQKRQAIGFSIDEARDADGKFRVLKRENRIFDIKPEDTMTFNELTEWYLDIEKVKSLSYYPQLGIYLRHFNERFGHVQVGKVKPVDLENYQAWRKKEGYSDASVDNHIGAARSMINKAFENDLVGGEPVKSFRAVKKLLKFNANARDKILTLDEFYRLLDKLPAHARPVVATAFWTGMRKREIMTLTWDKVDLKERLIRLDPEDTKDRDARKVPICDTLHEILKGIPRAVHDNHVFLRAGKPFKEIVACLQRACRDAGIPYGRNEKDGFTLHDLRHCFNTYARKAGVAQSVIMKITGHSTNSMFYRYNTIDESDARQAMVQMKGYFANVDQTVDQGATGADI